MTIDFDNLQTITAADLLKAVNHAIAHLLLGGQSYTISGRTFNRGNLNDLYRLRDNLTREIQVAASATGALTALAEFGRPQ